MRSLVGFANCPVFEPGRSSGLAAAIGVSHLTAIVVIWSADVPLALRFLVTGILGLSAVRSFRRDAWRSSSDAVVRIARRPDGRWTLTRRDGVQWVGCLDDDCHVATPLAVVAIRDGRRRRFVPVAADALPPAEHRRLRVALKWSPGSLC